MSLAKYLHPAPSEPLHPVLQQWELKRVSAKATELRCEFWRERDGLTFRPAELFVHFLDGAGVDVTAPDSRLWDRRLDAWLVEKGAKAKSEPNEAERFGYALNDRFSGAIELVGDGYFNAVLAEFLGQEALGKLPDIAGKLSSVREHSPYQSETRGDCRAMIEEAIMSVGLDLTKRLRYDDAAATKILDGALAYYLDERFGLTNRQMLGW